MAEKKEEKQKKKLSEIPFPKNRSELLIQHGFIKSNAQDKYYTEETAEGAKIHLAKVGATQNTKSDVDEEDLEGIVPGNIALTGFPAPIKTYKLMWETFELAMEEPYFWVLDTFRDNFPEVFKLEDSFAAAENSAVFGHTQQRLGAQQDRVSQFLATSGKMIKELFQMIRELRIIDERLAYYNEVVEEIKKKRDDRKKGGDITLKGIFVDLVQGGGKSPASVYGMSRELEFITLPDLFFDAPPFKDTDEMEAHVRALEKDFNNNVLRVLLRHFRQYMQWREMTEKEHRNRREFLLRYLTQHFEVIRMYLSWLKPYLRHTGKLGFKEKNMDTPDLISAFEGSMIDIEILAKKSPGFGDYNACVIATFNYRVRSELRVQTEGYNRGPINLGRVEIHLRAYTWTNEQIEQYKRLKDRETMMFLGSVVSGVEGAMNDLMPMLDKYLAEAKEFQKKDDKADGTNDTRPVHTPQKTFMQKMFGDFYTPSSQKKSSPNKKDLLAKQQTNIASLGVARSIVLGSAWNTFHNFKKSHRMVAW